MKLLSRHFRDTEFFCPCSLCDSGEARVNSATIIALQKIRTAVGVPLLITSGIRCKAHNDAIENSAKNSWHVPRETIPDCSISHHLKPQLVSYAADFTYYDSELRTNDGILKLYVMATQNISVTGLGLYPGRVHLDTRPEGRARWVDKEWSWKK